MQQLILTGALLAAVAAAPAQDFTRTMTAGEQAAAGLAKLTPEELARLKAAVERYKSGELAAGEEGAAKAGREAKERAAAAESAGKRQPAWLGALATLRRVNEKPEEQEALETRLAGDFRGWERGTVFVLENGQRWQVSDGAQYFSPVLPPPKVWIRPGAFGSFWMEFEGVKTKVKVKPITL